MCIRDRINTTVASAIKGSADPLAVMPLAGGRQPKGRITWLARVQEVGDGDGGRRRREGKGMGRTMLLQEIPPQSHKVDTRPALREPLIARVHELHMQLIPFLDHTGLNVIEEAP